MPLSLQMPNLPRCNDMEGAMKAFLKVLVFIAAVLLVPACGPGATPTPTPTPAPTPVLAAKADDIVGTWVGIGADALYERFNADGTLQVAKSLKNLADKPDARMTFRFEGTRLILTEVEAIGLPSCDAKTAVYEVQLLPDGNMKFVAIDDKCSPRKRSTAKTHKPVQ